MEDFLLQVWQVLIQIVSNLTNPEAWKAILGRPEVFWAAFVAVNFIVFTETGLLVGFFLPGDSLLVTLGIVAHGVGWDSQSVMILVGSLCASAVIGDTVGYWIGVKAGPRLFQKEESRFFNKKHLLAAQEFYNLHGGKTIIIARFMPFLRTFAPVVAGIGRMEYRRFLSYNLIGGVSWILSMFLLGFTLHLWLEPILRPIFGENFKVEKQIDKVVIAIVLLSVAPMAYKAFRGWLVKRRATREIVQQSAPML
ncbi:MAG: VTT domain-containing protein [Bacteroidales bacterium]|nr:VTT domain-containing protein [Bacteroidales bacterium]